MPKNTWYSTKCPRNFEDFPVKSLRTDIFPDHTNLGGGSFFGHRNFSHTNCYSTEHSSRSSTDVQSSHFVNLSLLHLCPVNSTVLGLLVYQDSILSSQLIEFIAFHLTGITVLRSVITNIFQMTILYILNILQMEE